MTFDRPRLVVLDACAIINFAASGRIEQVIGSITGSANVSEVVLRETLYVKRGGGGEDHDERVPIDLKPLIAAGLLEVLTPDEDELLTFLRYAVDLDDGEAMALALAEHRGAVVVTDDRKAIREASGKIEIWSSLSIVKAWFEQAAIDAESQANVLRSIRDRASYIPGSSHPLRGWWREVLGD